MIPELVKKIVRPLPFQYRFSINFLVRHWKEGWWRTYAVIGFYPVLRLFESVPRVGEWLKLHKLLYTLRYHTLVDYSRLRKLYQLAGDTLSKFQNGCVVECGVWQGGSAAIFGVQARRFKPDTDFWLFDSFEGLPEPLEIDRTWSGRMPQKGELTGSRTMVEQLLFSTLLLDQDRYRIIEGWFSDTFPSTVPRIGPIAILNIDCDFYEPVKLCLEELYPKVLPGGLVLLDDYHYFKGCRKATDEFMRDHKIASPLNPADKFGVYFHKPVKE